MGDASAPGQRLEPRREPAASKRTYQAHAHAEGRFIQTTDNVLNLGAHGAGNGGLVRERRRAASTALTGTAGFERTAAAVVSFLGFSDWDEGKKDKQGERCGGREVERSGRSVRDGGRAEEAAEAAGDTCGDRAGHGTRDPGQVRGMHIGTKVRAASITLAVAPGIMGGRARAVRGPRAGQRDGAPYDRRILERSGRGSQPRK